MKETKTDRQKWMDIAEKETLVYISFKKNRLRFADSDEVTGFDDEILMSKVPKTYDKHAICNLCYDLGLKNFMFLDKSEGHVPAEKKRAYIDMITDYKNYMAKRYILLLKLYGSVDALKYLSSEHMLILVKFEDSKMKAYTADYDGKPYMLCFTSKDELAFYKDEIKSTPELIENYRPLSVRLRKMFKLLDKDTGVYINPRTIPLCDRPLDVKLEHGLLKQYIKGVK